MSSSTESEVRIQGRDVFRRGVDLHHGLVRKLINAQGTGRVVGHTDAEVTCTLSMYINRPDLGTENDLQLIYRHNRNNLFVKKLTNIVPVGLQIAICSMSVNEHASFWVDPLMAFAGVGLAFGEDSGASVPANASVVFDIKLISFREPELTRIGFEGKRLTIESMPLIQRELDEAQNLLDRGNRSSAQKQWCRTITKLKSMRIDAKANHKDEESREAVLLDVLKKAGENALQLGWYKLAVTFNRDVTQMEATNSYAHYLLARAYFSLGHNSGARFYMKRAKLMDMSNELYSQKLAEIERHCDLLDEDSESEDELEDNEMLADIIEERLQSKRKQLIKDLSRELKKQIKENMTLIVFEGGFDESFLDIINERLIECNKGTNSVIVKRLLKRLEIAIL